MKLKNKEIILSKVNEHIGQYLSMGQEKNYVVFLINSKYFPMSVMKSFFKDYFDKNIDKEDTKKKLIVKIEEILTTIRQKAGSGDSILILDTKKMEVNLQKD